MRKKFLFAVMALLTMATGKIWAEDEDETTPKTACVVFDNNTLYFLCIDNAPLEGETKEISVDGGTKKVTLKEGNFWTGDAVLNSGDSPGWNSLSNDEKRSITRVVFEESFENAQPTTCKSWFNGFIYLQTIDGLENLNTSNVKDMSDMFHGCGYLKSITFGETFNTSAVTNMSNMFMYCSGLTSLDLDNFNTSNVTNMSGMFYGCRKLGSQEQDSQKSLKLSNFDTSNVTDMSNMFFNCNSLKTLDLSNFDTSKVTNMSGMFKNDYYPENNSLTSLNLSDKFNTSAVTNMSEMFYYCNSLKTITFGENFNTSNVINMSKMFYNCFSLTSLTLSSFNTSNVTDMSSMFYFCNNLKTITFGENFNTSEVIYMNGMFEYCSGLTSLDLSSFNTSKVTNMSYMFVGCSRLEKIDLSSFDTSKVADNMSNMFNDRSTNKIAIGGNALVFVANDTQKTKWEKNTTGAKFVVKNENGGSTYDGDIEIKSENIKQTLNIPYDFTANKVTFIRTFTADMPHTICLPFAVTNTADYGTFYEYSSYKDGKVIFAKVEETEPNTPYLFIPNKEVTEITAGTGDANSVTISSTRSDLSYGDDGCCFIGVYEKKIFTKEEAEDGIYYGWTSNSDGKGEFRKAGKDASVPPCRAYIMLPKSAPEASGAPARLSVQLGDGDTTGINAVESGADGGADAPMYNLQGQRVGCSYKGVVIKNGKKVIMK